MLALADEGYVLLNKRQKQFYFAYPVVRTGLTVGIKATIIFEKQAILK